ncbi:hypothetical protein C482_18677 [Natrialba chahannaoensis JCM 10990]|uniref:Uncharacterized protein n=1 Tax=Natrialba chahannaoensis JCM 10990 TaxID=1227492 RepID=M0A8Z5_9EURY|nr:hypothetical protein [Natrialba chahannaoensis]ELY94362.1 hypothetical protein C482_18677 [Natrialba chahannaoensis JCM 10990]
MIGQTGFVVLVALIWLSATAFGGLVVYWFLRQGFAEDGVESGQQFEPEPWSYTKVSLLIWVGFFVLLLALLVIAG